MAAGRQIYVVYPLVEESEALDLKAATDMARHLADEVFPDLTVGLLHGRLGFEEKDAIMRRFKAGEIHVLVSTTVIEVWIDVPNASVMLIEHAERFGLSQLHQLRGRVGRGAHQSCCVLLYQAPLNDQGRERLKALTETNEAQSTQETHSLLIVDLGDARRFALPTSMVSRLEKAPRSAIEFAGGREVIQYRGDILPLVRLIDVFGSTTDAPEPEELQVVVYAEQGNSYGLVVNRIVDVARQRCFGAGPLAREAAPQREAGWAAAQ